MADKHSRELDTDTMKSTPAGRLADNKGPTAIGSGGGCTKDRARNVTKSDWVCQDCALVCLGRGRQDAASD